MKRALLLTFLLVLLMGCESKEVSVLEIESEKSITPTHMATFEVEGMMCQKGCGAAIRKGLYDTGGVSEVEVTFDEENPINEIKVFFDINKTSTQKMIMVIGSLADNRYSAKLKKVTESTLSPLKVNSDEKSSNHKMNIISSREVSTKSFTFPNLTKLLNGLIN